MNFLVIQNGSKLKSSLQYLDPLPADNSRLSKAREAQDAIRYQDGEFNLLEVCHLENKRWTFLLGCHKCELIMDGRKCIF